MSIRSTSEVVTTTTAVCDNPECDTIHSVSNGENLPGLIILEARLFGDGVEVPVKDLYVCKGSCTANALKSVIEHGV